MPSPPHPPPSNPANRTLLQSYAALPPRTRLSFSLAVCGVAAAGIFISDYLERLPARQTEKR